LVHESSCGLGGVTIVLAQDRAVAVVHGSRVHTSERLTLRRTSATRLASAGMLLAEAATALVPRLTLTLTMALAMRLTRPL
jgi:hypothetical protein